MSDVIEITITGFDAKGRGTADTIRGPVAVPFTIPGDTVRTALRGKRQGVWRGIAIARSAEGAGRIEPQCPFVGRCGGCPWQMVDYPAQLRAKRALVQRALDGAVIPMVPEVEPSPDVFYYRNRMDYVVGADGSLGLKGPEQWWNVLDLTTCLLLSPEAVELMARFRAWMRAHDVRPWDHRTHQGFARYLVLREGKRTGERLAMIVTAPGELPGRDDLVARFQDLTTSILWGINPKITDLSIAETIHVLHGSEVLHERLLLSPSSPHATMTTSGSSDVLRETLWSPSGHGSACGGERGRNMSENDSLGHSSVLEEHIRDPIAAAKSLTFAIPPNAFFQTNTAMAERLVETVRELAALQQTDFLVDLYCGVGVFTLALARDAERAVGVEADLAAIPAAQGNAVANGVTNARFDLATAEAWPFPIDPIDCLVVDPPRSGLHPRVIQKILALQPRRLIYVSCSPTALARDLKPILARYTCDAIRCLDLFPHTPHVETVVRLIRI